ncbi:uncharacterized protein [Rutidosis leptorrhynchoides]|uniref:uncharacterized protein n=1 Tax=Rutidosis leptorrhynchoides TaxID=125765 RepID=UPI003A99B7FC
MNTAYGHHHGYNTVKNENDDMDNVANNTGDVFHLDMNGNSSDMVDMDNENNNNDEGDTKENSVVADANYNGFGLVNDVLNQLNENDSDIPANGDGEPPAVPPFSSGEGLPFAPEDWPNPGDKWRWKVGKRVQTSGYYTDRWLYLPKSLIVTKNRPKPFGSKPAVERYIAESFPAADANAFFASFSWKIRSNQDLKLKDLGMEVETAGLLPINLCGKLMYKTVGMFIAASQSITAIPDPASTQGATEGIENEEAPTTQGRSKRKAALKAPAKWAALICAVETDCDEDTLKKRQKQKAEGDASALVKRRSSGRQKKLAEIAETASETRKQKATSGRKTLQQLATTTTSENAAEEEPPIDPVEFDKYLTCLDDMISPPTSVEIVQQTDTTTIYTPDPEIMKARTKLHSLLDMDFPCLFRAGKVNELLNLASIIRLDPSLSAKQLVKLKLIEEIPTYCQVYLENRDIADHAENFLVALEANKEKVTSLMNEYGGLKEQATILQTEADHGKSAVEEIDEQIELLETQRTKLAAYMKDKKKRMSDLTSVQNTVAHSIPKVVQEIQIAKSKISEWEYKRQNAARRETEILDRFFPLVGFCL